VGAEEASVGERPAMAKPAGRADARIVVSAKDAGSVAYHRQASDRGRPPTRRGARQRRPTRLGGQYDTNAPPMIHLRGTGPQ
jgi:hypothetical protein